MRSIATHYFISGDMLVNDLRLTQSLSAFIAFAWNFLLPIGMIFLCILQYRVSNANTFFNWKHGGYWPLWARQFGGFIQVSFLLLIPIVTIVQIYRYLSKGPPDILDVSSISSKLEINEKMNQSFFSSQRFDLLLRPSMGSSNEAVINSSRIQHARRPAPPLPVRTANTGSTMISLESRAPQDDAPPKYTPPPSYTTATGARIAKMLRNSIRRSVRRFVRKIITRHQNSTSLSCPFLSHPELWAKQAETGSAVPFSSSTNTPNKPQQIRPEMKSPRRTIPLF